MKTFFYYFIMICMFVPIILIHTSCKKDNQKPTAHFTITPDKGTTLTVYTFDASGCHDSEDPTSDLQVRWDFDGDGAWDTDWEYNKVKEHQYSKEGTYTVKKEVKDTKGLTNDIVQNIIVGAGIGTFTDPRNGQKYKYAVIGSQTWMAENLNYETSNSYWYNDSSSNGDIYGRLYTWEAALTACPSGWHLPTDNEWKQMEIAIGMNQYTADDEAWRGTYEGYNLKSESGWIEDGNGTNSTGFNALPGGYFDSGYDKFTSIGSQGFWWSSTDGGDDLSWHRALYYDQNGVCRYIYLKNSGFSVRCIKD